MYIEKKKNDKQHKYVLLVSMGLSLKHEEEYDFCSNNIRVK